MRAQSCAPDSKETEMNKIDRMIEEALAEEDSAVLEATAEQGYLALIVGQFRGKNGWVTWLSTVAMLAYGVLAVWTAWRFFTLEDPMQALKYGLVAVVSVIVVGMFKLNLLYTAQIDRVVRELKRVELMLANRRD
jgi:hypothetical protein